MKFSYVQLCEVAKAIPAVPRSDVFSVALPLSWEEAWYRPHDPLDHYEFSRIEFRVRSERLNGARVWAWYYHDLLVKVFPQG